MTVTIKSMSDLDTSHAVIQTDHTREDAIEFCQEYVQEDPVTENCIKQGLSVRLNDAIFYADCPRGVFTDFAGDKYQFRGKNPHPGEMGPKYLLMNLSMDRFEHHTCMALRSITARPSIVPRPGTIGCSRMNSTNSRERP